jgi:hypothetical protein
MPKPKLGFRSCQIVFNTFGVTANYKTAELTNLTKYCLTTHDIAQDYSLSENKTTIKV